MSCYRRAHNSTGTHDQISITRLEMRDSCGQLGHLHSTKLCIKVSCIVEFPDVGGDWGKTRDAVQPVGQKRYLA